MNDEKPKKKELSLGPPEKLFLTLMLASLTYISKPEVFGAFLGLLKYMKEIFLDVEKTKILTDYGTSLTGRENYIDFYTFTINQIEGIQDIITTPNLKATSEEEVMIKSAALLEVCINDAMNSIKTGPPPPKSGPKETTH